MIAARLNAGYTMNVYSKIMCPDESSPDCGMPLYMVSVSAGFPSPADDYLDGKLDLNDYLIKHRAATFFLRAAGDSMIDAGIHSGDILIVDRSINPVDNNVVIAVLDGELTVKRIRKSADELLLMPENKNYEPVRVTGDMHVEIWGVVTTVIHSLR
ncbi:LexA family protein [Candidatus Latescibacterota bacterium]